MGLADNGESYESKIMSERIDLPGATLSEFINQADSAVASFENNKITSLIIENKISIQHYHDLLLKLFHQVNLSSATFAMAGSMITDDLPKVKNYLYHHAEEEKLHWTWIISDLRSTNYKGKDPREMYPESATTAYFSYAHYLAIKMPIGRLAMAYVLESISAKFGAKYGLKFMTQVGLKPEQMRFFLSHGELDVGHTEDILKILNQLNLSVHDWALMVHAAKTTASLYKNIYNSVI